MNEYPRGRMALAKEILELLDGGGNIKELCEKVIDGYGFVQADVPAPVPQPVAVEAEEAPVSPFTDDLERARAERDRGLDDDD